MNIVLTGFMGTGKSAVGQKVAAALGYRFMDVDAVIESERRQTIAAIFQREGEARFRDMETETIQKLAQEDQAVLATGGGALLRKANVAALSKNGVLVCLTAAPETIFRRLQGDATRPLLAGKDPLSEIRRLLAEREPYCSACSIQVSTDGKTIEAVADEVMAQTLPVLAAMEKKRASKP